MVSNFELRKFKAEVAQSERVFVMEVTPKSKEVVHKVNDKAAHNVNGKAAHNVNGKVAHKVDDEVAHKVNEISNKWKKGGRKPRADENQLGQHGRDEMEIME